MLINAQIHWNIFAYKGEFSYMLQRGASLGSASSILTWLMSSLLNLKKNNSSGLLGLSIFLLKTSIIKRTLNVSLQSFSILLSILYFELKDL